MVCCHPIIVELFAAVVSLLKMASLLCTLEYRFDQDCKCALYTFIASRKLKAISATHWCEYAVVDICTISES